MMSREAREHRDLVDALVRERWRGLYSNSAAFHANIEALARMLPLWIDAIATQDERQDRAMAEELARMRERRQLKHPLED